MTTILDATEPTAALVLVDKLPAWQTDSAQNPAAVYLRGLATGSRAAMTSALRTAAGLLGWHGDPLNFPWQELRYSHVSALRAALADRGAPASANRTLSAVRGVLRTAWRLDLIPDADYHRAIDVPNVKGTPAPHGRHVAADELATMLDLCAADPHPAGIRDAAILAVAFGSGCRRAEIAALDLADLNLTAGELVVHKGKGGKARVVPMIPGALAAVRRWVRLRGRDPGPLFCATSRGGRVLRDQRMTGRTIGRAISERARRADLDHLTAHDCRRTFVGNLLDNGADLAIVQSLAGHASPATTSRYDRRPARARAAAVAAVPWPSSERRPVTGVLSSLTSEEQA